MFWDNFNIYVIPSIFYHNQDSLSFFLHPFLSRTSRQKKMGTAEAKQPLLILFHLFDALPPPFCHDLLSQPTSEWSLARWRTESLAKGCSRGGRGEREIEKRERKRVHALTVGIHEPSLPRRLACERTLWPRRFSRSNLPHSPLELAVISFNPSAPTITVFLQSYIRARGNESGQSLHDPSGSPFAVSSFPRQQLSNDSFGHDDERKLGRVWKDEEGKYEWGEFLASRKRGHTNVC